jgi:hypothetical protein
MFSVSLPTCSGTDARAALEAALAQVAEESFFAVVEVAPDDWRESSPVESDWLEATVAFHGAGEGVLTCRLPGALARDLSMAFLGADVDDTPGGIDDMVGEVANMICGCWLTRAFPTRLFQLDGPIIRRDVAAPSGDWLVHLLNGVPLGLAVSANGV